VKCKTISVLCHSRRTIILIAIVAVIAIMASAIVATILEKYENLYVPSIGTIRTVGVQAIGGDINQTIQGRQYIDWGEIYPGTQTNRSFALRSVSNSDITLQLNTTNWQPTDISDYLNLSWNYTEETIRPQQTIWVMLTLSSSSKQSFISYIIGNNVTAFDFDISITPTRQ
jgi:hypothetical protein